MRIIGLFVALFLALCPVALADDPPTVVEDPQGFFQDFKEFVDRTDPAFEELVSFRHWEFYEGFSGSLVKIAPNDLELVDVRAGYALDKIGYASFPVNLANLGNKYLPDVVNEFFDKVPTPLKGKVAEYGKVGGWAGWNFSDSEVDGGATLGVAIPW